MPQPPIRRQLLARLTPRERDVAGLAAAGKSHREIALRLHISHLTVRNHLVSIYEKLGVHTKAELAAIWASESPGPV